MSRCAVHILHNLVDLWNCPGLRPAHGLRKYFRPKEKQQMKIRFISLALVKTINHFYFVVSPQVPWLHSVYAVLGAILFTMVSTMQF